MTRSLFCMGGKILRGSDNTAPPPSRDVLGFRCAAPPLAIVRSIITDPNVVTAASWSASLAALKSQSVSEDDPARGRMASAGALARQRRALNARPPPLRAQPRSS